MKKRLIILLSSILAVALIITIILNYYNHVSKISSSLDVTSSETPPTEVRLYSMPRVMESIAYFGSIDGYAKALVGNKTIYDYSEIITLNEIGDVVYEDNKKYTYLKSDFSFISKAVFDPKCVLDSVIDKKYTVERVLWICSDDQLIREVAVYYETNRGIYVLFLPLRYYTQESFDGVMYLVPYKIVEEKTLEILKTHETGLMGASPYYSGKYFDDYRFEFPEN